MQRLTLCARGRGWRESQREQIEGNRVETSRDEWRRADE